MPTKDQLKLASAPLLKKSGESWKRREMLELRVGNNNESDDNAESTSDIEPVSKGDVFAPSKLVTNSEVDPQRNKTPQTKKNNNTMDESTVWAISICTEEGFRSGTSEFATCVAEIRLVY